MKAVPKPDWLKIKLNTNTHYKFLKNLVKEEKLHTVCEEARCPNIHECWGEYRTATFMILGDVCTRRCRFCAIKTGLPRAVDREEPQRVAKSIKKLALKHAVITMVDRDDLRDAGAHIVAHTVYAIRKEAPDCSIELLTGDFMGRAELIRKVVESNPDIMSHNVETVRRLTPQVRSRSEYERSLRVLSLSKEIDAHIVTKSSIMLGLGEKKEEVLHTMDDLLTHGVQMMNIGQYLQPSPKHLSVQKYWHPEEFAELKEIALEKGFIHCESGALVRSSYHAGDDYESFRKSVHPLYRSEKK